MAKLEPVTPVMKNGNIYHKEKQVTNYVTDCVKLVWLKSVFRVADKKLIKKSKADRNNFM